MLEGYEGAGSYCDVERLLIQRRGDWWERLCAMVPEVAALVSVVQPPRFHGEGDVATHTRLTVEACGVGADPDLLWAALLHDVGKAVVTRVEDGVVRAHGHAKVGAQLAGQALGRLGMDAKRRETIIWLVRHHQFHLSWRLTALDQVSRRQRRIVADERFGLLLELLRVDSLASHGSSKGMEAYGFYRQLKALVDGDGVELNQVEG